MLSHNAGLYGTSCVFLTDDSQIYCIDSNQIWLSNGDHMVGCATCGSKSAICLRLLSLKSLPAAALGNKSTVCSPVYPSLLFASTDL